MPTSIVPFACLFCCIAAAKAAAADWAVVVPETYADEEAVQVALRDLAEAADANEIHLSILSPGDWKGGNAILVGGPARNAASRELRDKGALTFDETVKAEGYHIATAASPAGQVVVVAGGSVLGDAYGLFYLRDRLLVFCGVPELNVTREPALDLRYSRIPVRSKADIQTRLRYGLNLVYGENPLRLIPWTSPGENEEFREKTRELASYAHQCHMKFLAFGTDFTYHPSLLEEFGASLNPADPRLWEAVQAKYRRLFEAMPELDGVGTFTADEQRFWGDYRTFDVMHDGDGCDWALEKRYRMFVTKVWEVVVGEFGKLLLHRTWATNMYEQQAQPDIYRRIFTDEVPVRNLYLIPSFTQNDRWWFQASNPTINQTPHNTMVVCEPMDYHAGGNVFPTYPGVYFQAGLQQMLDVERTNLCGASLDIPAADDWHTRSLTAYTVSRLSWNPHEDPRAIARDFAAIQFGREVAEEMADVLLLSPVAYKYGLYIEPAAYGQFNSLPHIRVGQFVAQGYPRIDGGKEHVEFLRGLYLRCKPWIPETLMYLDHGLGAAETMVEKYEDVRGRIAGAPRAQDVHDSLRQTLWLIRTNNAYVRTIFAYFRYREEPSEANRNRLAESQAELKRTRDAFANAPGFGYQLFGVDQLIENAGDALRDLARAEKALREAPTTAEIDEAVAREQAEYAELLARYKDEAVRILHWRGKIDGRDIVRVRGSEVMLEHLRWDGPYVEFATVVNPLPRKACTVVPKDIQSRPVHAFVLEHPAEANGYTAEVYLNDVPGGADWWEFELYAIPRPPSELGLRPSLRSRE